VLKHREQAYLGTINAKRAFSAANEQLISATKLSYYTNVQLKLGAINTLSIAA